MPVSNNTILGNLALQGTNDFAQRVTTGTQAAIAQTAENIFDPLNTRVYNEFVAGLVNRIGMTYCHNKSFQNPLAIFMKGRLPFGSTVQEIATKWVRSHSYDDAAETLLKMERPEVVAAYHSMNRQENYPISISRQELRQAFADEYGLNNLVASIMQAPINSDEYDQYQIMKQLIAEYETHQGFFKVNVANPTNEATAKALLKELRAYAEKLRFPSTLYNATDVAVFTSPERCVLLVTPSIKASIDVDALASVFHLGRADVLQRIIVVDEFPIDDMYALLIDEDFFQCYDIEYSTTSFFDPETLAEKWFLHHWQTLSCSPVAPAVAFGGFNASTVPTVTMAASALTITADSNTVVPGGTVQLHAKLTGTITANDESAVVAPDSVLWTIALQDAEKNSRTYIDRFNVLHVQKSVEAGEVITISAVSTYANPDGTTPVLVGTKTITVA